MKDSHEPQLQYSSMYVFILDLPNIATLAGLLSAVVGIYYAILGNFPAAIIGLIWAVLFDWSDGMIARHMTGRTDEYKAFGKQLDSLIDIVSFGILPAILLLSYGEFSPLFLPGAFAIVAASAIRLSYFNVFGLIDNATYMGLAVDNGGIILAFVFLFDGVFSHETFSIIIYATCIIITVLYIAPIRTPKFTGKWFYILVMYALVLTTIYGWLLWIRIQ